MNKKTKKKIQIAEAACQRYIENPRFTIRSLAELLKMESKEIFEHFPNRRSILEFYYEAQFLKYKESLSDIDGYDTFTLSEKMSNLALTLLDSFEEQREFVLLTYRKKIVCSHQPSGFEKLMKDEIQQIVKDDKNICSSGKLVNGSISSKAVLLHFHGLVKFWMNDSSQGNQKTMELVDKWTALAESILYTKVADRATDLAKFFLYNSPLSTLFKKSGEKHV